MNMREMHEYVHGMVNTDVVDVKLKLVPCMYSSEPDKDMHVQMQMSVAVQRSDFSLRRERDLEYFDFSLKSGPVIWRDDYEIKDMLKHMVIYMTRKMGIMIIQGRGKDLT